MNSHSEEQNQSVGHWPYSPSFNCYSNNSRIVDIAARVAAESPTLHTTPHIPSILGEVDEEDDDDDGDENDDEDFEFNLISTESEIPPVYPVFDPGLLRDLQIGESTVPIQLGQLFLAEDCDPVRLPLASSSVAAVDELEGASPGTHCVWAPKTPSPSPSPGRCIKSNSTGSASSPAPAMSKTWRLRNLLRRCKSDGNEGLVLLTPKEKGKEKDREGRREKWEKRPAGSNRRRSYLPYKPDLLGFFASPQQLRSIKIPPL